MYPKLLRNSQIMHTFECVNILFQAGTAALAQSVLAELPDQVASFFNLFHLKPPSEPSPS